MIVFRDYQEYAIDSIFSYYEAGNSGNPIVVMPTGTGKSLVIGGFIHKAMKLYPGLRVIKLTHLKELIEQNFEKLLALWPTAPAGIYSAGLGRKDIGYSITYAGIATAINAIELFGYIDLILIDECHLVSQKDNSRYLTFIRSLKLLNPNLKVIGFTATHYRVGQGLLIEEGGIFTDICCDMSTLESFNWFVSEGYLSPLIPKATSTTLNIDNVAIHGGEFDSKQLQLAVDIEGVTRAAIEEAMVLGVDREHWLVFATGIEHVLHVTEELNRLGVSATCVHSKQPASDRDKNLKDYRAGKYRALVNNGILTTGFDYAEIDLILMLRPTHSPGLWVQMLGRGTRPLYAPGFDLSTAEGRLLAISEGGKKNCLVLDYARNTLRLGPINDPVIPKKKGRGQKGSAPIKLCEVCGTLCHASVTTCPDCGFEFPKAVKIGVVADTLALIKLPDEAPQIEDFAVDRVVYSIYTKAGRNSLKVSYYCGLRKFDEWICLEHGGYAKRKAHLWWKDHSLEAPPATIEEAIQKATELRTPIVIKVWINKKFPEIMAYVYGSGWFPAKNAEDLPF